MIIFDLSYQRYSKLWKFSGPDYNETGRYKLGTVEITVEDCDGDYAYLTIMHNGKAVVATERYEDAAHAYEAAEDFLVSIGYLVRNEEYREMKIPKLPKKRRF